MIPNSLSRHFSAAIRSRGEAYFAAGKVRIDLVTPVQVQAVVHGSMDYNVKIAAHDTVLDISCTCPFAIDTGSCKHLWAVILQCNAEGTLRQLLGETGMRNPARIGGYSMPQPVAPAKLDWVRVIEQAHVQMKSRAPAPSLLKAPDVWPENRRLVYILDADETSITGDIMIDLGTELRAANGTWGEAKRFSLKPELWFASPEPIDRQIAEMLCGSSASQFYQRQQTTGFSIGASAFETTLRFILDTGRCRLRSRLPSLTGRTMRFDAGAAWTFRVRVSRDASDKQVLSGVLVRNDEEMLVSKPFILSAEGFLIVNDTVARFEHSGAFPLVMELREHGPTLPAPEDISEILTRLYALPRVPELELPGATSVIESRVNPQVTATISSRTTGWAGIQSFVLDYEFRYGALHSQPAASALSLFDKTGGVLHHRQVAFEQACRSRLLALGAKEEFDFNLRREVLLVKRAKLGLLTRTLMREGWQVNVEGIKYRSPGAITASVSSGIDWFDLRGTVQYGDVEVPISAILDAHRRGDEFVQVDEFSLGTLPTDWLDRLGPLIAAGSSIDGNTRYRRAQLSVLDALLATLPEADLDETFETARAELDTFATVAAIDPPSTFSGTLREYQREGLGWLHFLRRFGLGGCLADDMGLGKTVQVLALLEGRRLDGHGPSLVVVPRSLVFNWIREAARFTPAMRVLDFSGTNRTLASIHPSQVDLVVTTYGNLRRDAPLLAEIEFDYAVLDEAQAIKNPSTATAKASRLLRAKHRLAMSGTPIENRIEELWSLLEFLNPGMLGASTKFATLARLSSMSDADVSDVGDIGDGSDVAINESDDREDEGFTLLSRALRPVILRRTKEHVAPELPVRIEQTIEVELEPKQRKFYEEIRRRVQQDVMARVEQDGIQKSQLHILEALLRLRQAACHPALVDPSKVTLPSAKLDALVPALASISAEGHKTLVFSQFTSFLALVRERLDESGIRYEYLDGRTRDRQERVDRFQEDAGCPVFLISLKAGGHGLNLTAADYVYLLDPWWNPAVEAQAIDRAHRIGQTRRVIATRLVARDTIEAKILQLQSTKRALADAVLTADKGGLASIGRSELELLLG